ncbi:MAG: hypothetical protein IPP15_23215 [Saprospiraceae bacterium]|uniref:Uncharacterized protein n=1 Tax=Candidatus Opimibacter skivensis TaxID=2982028 RepID=A0A9D7T0A5_9BACT|nr:hypothetical protein [Candidatus Opimibacter skivensis]
MIHPTNKDENVKTKNSDQEQGERTKRFFSQFNQRDTGMSVVHFHCLSDCSQTGSAYVRQHQVDQQMNILDSENRYFNAPYDCRS